MDIESKVSKDIGQKFGLMETDLTQLAPGARARALGRIEEETTKLVAKYKADPKVGHLEQLRAEAAQLVRPARLIQTSSTAVSPG